MKKQLIRLANNLDKKGFSKEADYIDILLKEASEGSTAYILYQDFPQEGVELVAVFSDEEKAKEAKNKLLTENKRGRYVVEEIDYNPHINDIEF